MSQVSCGQPCLLDPAVEYPIERIKTSAQLGIVPSFLGNDLGEAGAQEPIIRAGAKQDRSIPLSRYPIAMGPRNPLDQPMQAKSPQMVRHLARSYVVGRLPQQGSPMVPQVAVGKTSGQQTKHQKRAEQSLHQHVGEAQGAGALSLDLDRLMDRAECVFADGTVLADPLDVEETSVGVEADPPQGGQVGQPFADTEVARVVDRGLGPQGAAF